MFLSLTDLHHSLPVCPRMVILGIHLYGGISDLGTGQGTPLNTLCFDLMTQRKKKQQSPQSL